MSYARNQNELPVGGDQIKCEASRNRCKWQNDCIRARVFDLGRAQLLPRALPKGGVKFILLNRRTIER